MFATTVSQSVINEVLNCKAATPAAFRFVKPLPVEPGSKFAQLIEDAAQKVRRAYSSGTRRVANDETYPERFADAAFDTVHAIQEVEQYFEDDTSACLAAAIIETAVGFDSIKPTTDAAQVAMQIEAIDAVKKLRPLFATQTALAF